MKNFVIFLLSLIILVGGAAVAYPQYTNYVEDQIANWVTVENARHPDATFSYQTLEARPLTSEIIIHGLSFDTKDETTTIQRAEVTVDSFLLLTRVNSVKQAQFLVADSAQSKTAQILRKALASADQFDLKAIIDGDLNDPTIKLKSSLDSLIGKALGDEVKAKVAEQKAALQEKLAAQLQDPTAKLAGSGAFLDDYKNRLGTQREALKSLLTQMR